MGGNTRRFSSVHDTIGFFAKSKDYHFDIDAVRIPYDEETKKARSRSIFVGKKWLEVGYNPKDVWSISRLHAIHSEREDHPTQKPLEVIERMIKASCPVNGIVLDPFMGSGTTAVAAHRLKRKFVGFEINADYCEVIRQRLLDEGAFKLKSPRLKSPQQLAAPNPGETSRVCLNTRWRQSQLAVFVISTGWQTSTGWPLR